MALNTISIAGRRLSAGRPVIPADGDEPIVSARMILAKYDGHEREVPVWIEKGTRLIDTMTLISDVYLPQPDIYPSGRIFFERTLQSRARGGPSRETIGISGDAQRPWPRDVFSSNLCAAFLKSNCEQHV